MSDEVFWGLTFEEYFARESRFLDQEKTWDIRFGVIGATVINWSGKSLREGAPAISAETLFGYNSSASASNQKVDDGEDYEMTPEESIIHAMAMTKPKVA